MASREFSGASSSGPCAQTALNNQELKEGTVNINLNFKSLLFEICLSDFTWTMKRFHSRVDSPVPRQLLIPCESLSTGRMRAPERPLARVDPHVASQLPVVAEPGATLAAPELLRPGSSLVQLQLVGKVLCRQRVG